MAERQEDVGDGCSIEAQNNADFRNINDLEENIDLKVNREDVDKWILNLISLKNDDERKFCGVTERVSSGKFSIQNEKTIQTILCFYPVLFQKNLAEIHLY